MPSFTAFALDRLLEPGASKSVDKSVARSNPVSKPKDIPKPDSARNNLNLERGNSVPILERKVSRPQISPALYATPEATPLPDSPSSFPPSPYIINHKRRGPRLLKSFSEVDVATCEKALEEVKGDESAKNEEAKVADASEPRSVTFIIEEERSNGVDHNFMKQEHVTRAQGCRIEGECANGLPASEVGNSDSTLGGNGTREICTVEKDMSKFVVSNLEKDSECEDIFDSQKSMGSSNTDREDSAGVESSLKYAATTPIGEFFDAWDEFSSESGKQPAFDDDEADLREMRLGLSLEIEKRKQAEEALKNMQSQWQRIRQELAIVGLRLPACPVDIAEGDQMVDANPVEELCQQLYLARFVSDSIGRGVAKAEMQMEMKAQIEAKNAEIARLLDRLHYYEAVNREMSQRNQEAVEMGRRNRLVRKRRQRWVWGSIAAATTLGAAALAWSYVPARGSSSSVSSALEHNDTAK